MRQERDERAETIAFTFLRQAEGFSPLPYEDPKGSGRYSVGYGFRLANMAQVEHYRRSPMTRQQADEMLRQRIREFAGVVRGAIGEAAWGQLTSEQRAALISFSYNIGPYAFSNSTVARKLAEGRMDEVPAAMQMWHRAGGKPGVLRARREAEIQLWSGDWRSSEPGLST